MIDHSCYSVQDIKAGMDKRVVQWTSLLMEQESLLLCLLPFSKLAQENSRCITAIHQSDQSRANVIQ